MENEKKVVSAGPVIMSPTQEALSKVVPKFPRYVQVGRADDQFFACGDCGAVVASKRIHDEFHDVV